MDNLDDTAAAALWRIALSLDPQKEHMALLYDNGGSLAQTPTVSGDSRNVKGAFTIPQGSARAIAHNHPVGFSEGKNRHYRRFAPDDMEMANKLGTPSYISHDKGFSRYEPGSNNPRGTPILAPIPLDEIRKKYIVDALQK